MNDNTKASDCFERLGFLLTCLPKERGYDFIQLPVPMAKAMFEEYEQLLFMFRCNTQRMNEYIAKYKQEPESE